MRQKVTYVRLGRKGKTDEYATHAHHIVNRKRVTYGVTEEMVVTLWLKQHSEKTQPEYRRDIQRLYTFTGKSIRELTLLDLQDFKESLAGLAKATIARKLSAIKSLLSFCHKAGYTSMNVGAALRNQKVEEKLAHRIMSEAQMQRILALEQHPRNHAMLRLMYNTGARVSEVVALTWNDLQERDQGAQVRLFGKGEKERYVLVSAETYEELLELRTNEPGQTPIFRSRKTTRGGYLNRGQINKIIEVAAIRAGIAVYEKKNSKGEIVKKSSVSPHWFRHAHASHSIDNGASLPLVRDTLGHANLVTTNKYSHARPGQSSGSYLKI